MKQVAVLIPCYNEAITIGNVIDNVKSVMPQALVYVYDNNSTDGTAQIAAEHGAIVDHEYRQGKGHVMRSMFRKIDADCYVMIDGDDTYSVQEMPAMCDMVLNQGVDMVVGCRTNYQDINRRPMHNTGNLMVRFLINKLFKSNGPDIMTGYRAMSRPFVKTFPVLSPGFEIETELSIHAADKRFRIVQVPIVYQDRPEGSESKLNTFSDGFKVLRMIASLFKDYKPFPFFGILCLISLVVALCLGVPVVGEFMATRAVARFPTAILAVAFAGLSALFLVCGILLDTIVKANRRQWEIDCYRAFDEERERREGGHQ
jgi:glycosyltransferase involved in cell wall biosynthesis